MLSAVNVQDRARYLRHLINACYAHYKQESTLFLFDVHEGKQAVVHGSDIKTDYVVLVVCVAFCNTGLRMAAHPPKTSIFESLKAVVNHLQCKMMSK